MTLEGGNGGDGWRKSTHSTTNGCVEVEVARTSSRCATGSCVEVLVAPDVVQVRNSHTPEGPLVVFTHTEWRDFLDGVRRGEFDV